MVKAIELYPYDEFWKVLEASELAIEKKDVDALIWCARRVMWFHDMGETEILELDDEATGRYFESAFKSSEKIDPPPALIADLVAPDKDAPPAVSADEAAAALDKLRQFLDGQEDMARKDYMAAVESIEALRGKLAPAAAGEGAA
jgi:hypothetical protein